MKHNIKEILEDNFWIPTLKAEEQYFITQDDCDGELKDGLTVTIDLQGDAWISTIGIRGMHTCRFRTFAGGGHNQRTRNTMMILAEAIRLDNLENKGE